jgi:hypothetical protein
MQCAAPASVATVGADQHSCVVTSMPSSTMSTAHFSLMVVPKSSYFSAMNLPTVRQQVTDAPHQQIVQSVVPQDGVALDQRNLAVNVPVRREA